jgi:dolichyl-phosphate beta-glucosyltransferase
MSSSGTMRPSALVIPCYNEATRLDDALLLELATTPTLSLVLVDDGSRDGTFARLSRLAHAHPAAITALQLPKNVGKGEATRAGLRACIEGGASVVGFADADFATPPSEILRLLGSLLEREAGECDVVLGSRVARLGARISRSPVRHGLGRVFATFSTLALGAQVYDTQCGAKWFRVGEPLVAALAKPFRSRWAFDLELLLRLVGRIDQPAPVLSLHQILEVPLRSWADVGGSKLRVTGMASALVEVLDLLRRAQLPAPFRGA